jgi:hypothetical protein
MRKHSPSSLLSTFVIIYFTAGFIFAILFAIYYHWHFLSFLSPGFYSVIFTWPYQALGFISDLLRYGLAGKPIF